MNRIYKVIWSKARNCYVVVSEIAKTHSKGGTGVSGVVRKAGSAALLTAAVTAMLITPLGTAWAEEVDISSNDDGSATAVFQNSNNSIKIGDETISASGKDSIVIGTNQAESAGRGGVAIGSRATVEAEAYRGTAVGDSAVASKRDDTAYGSGAVADGQQSTALGHDTTASGLESIAAGDNASAMKGSDVAVGHDATADAGSGTAVGAGSNVTGNSGSAFGAGAKVTGADGTALGTSAEATATKATATGADAKATNTNATATGTSAEATGEDSTALGSGAVADANRAVALGGGGVTDPTTGKQSGNSAQAHGMDSIAVGSGSRTAEDARSSVAIGGGGEDKGANAGAVGAVAVGTGTSASGVNSVAIGGGDEKDGANASADGAVAVGNNSKATVENGVALGAGSIASTGKDIEGYVPNPNRVPDTTISTWTSTEAAVSIGATDESGKPTMTRQITGVAAGTNDWDAANVAQLKAAMTHYYSVDTTKATDEAGNNNYDNDGAQSSGQNAIAAGVNVKATAANASAFGSNVTASGINATAIGTAGITAGDYSTAVGNSSVSASNYSAAMGYGSVSATGNSTAIGNNSISASGNSTAIGYGGVTATGQGSGSSYMGSLALGSNTVSASNGSTAIGGGSITASGTNSTAIGRNNVSATGPYATALGTNNTSAAGQNSTAIGSSAKIDSSSEGAHAFGKNVNVQSSSGGLALGNSTSLSGASGSTAVGSQTSVSGSNGSAAMGTSSKVTGSSNGSTAVGNSVTVESSSSGSAAFGTSTTITGSNGSTLVGNNSSITSSYGVSVLGVNTTISGSNGAIAMGNYASISGSSGAILLAENNSSISNSSGSTAIGNSVSISSGSGSNVFGDSSSINSDGGSMVLGNSSNITSGSGSHLLGNQSSVNSSAGSTVIGNSSSVAGGSNGSHVFGNSASVKEGSEGSVAIGNDSTVYGGSDGSYAIGGNAKVYGGSNGATAVGPNSEVSNGSGGSQAFGNAAKVTNGSGGASAVGSGALVDGSGGSDAFGNNAKVTGGGGSTAVGNNAQVAGSGGATAVGTNAYVGGSDNGLAVGARAKVTGGWAGTAIGTDSETTVSQGVALGSNALAERGPEEEDGYDPIGEHPGQEGTPTWRATAAAVSVGGKTFAKQNENGEYVDADGNVVETADKAEQITYTRQITNVAAGRLDTDAVNVAQLKQLAGQMAEEGSLSFGSDGYVPATETEPAKEQITKWHGQTLQIIGDTTYKTDETTSEPVVDKDGNIITSVDKAKDGTDAIKISLARDIDVDTVVVNGKDGAPGEPGTPGSIGMKGEDGEIKTVTITSEGKPGVDGKDGETITRLIVDDKPVATLDDGLKFGANAPEEEEGDNPVANKLNSTVKIVGVDAKEDHEYSADNLTTTVKQAEDGTTTITVMMDKDPEFDTLVVNGKDGAPGEPGTPGSIGMKGEDGEIKTVTITTEGAPGVDGKDGETITRLIVDDKPVATLDDGMKYSGDFGNTKDNPVAVKLNKNVDVVGNATAKSAEDLTDGNIGVVAEPEIDEETGEATGNAKLTIKLNKDINLGPDGSLVVGGTVNEEGDVINPITIANQTVVNQAGDEETGNYITNLDNRTWDPTNIVEGRAATEDQLAAVQTHYYSVNDIVDGKQQIQDNWDNKGATGKFALAAGTNTKAEGESATAVGNNAKASSLNSTAIGFAASADVADSVAIGSYSKANYGIPTEAGYDVATDDVYAGEGADSATWKATAGEISVGGKTETEITVDGQTQVITTETTRQIKNVAAGSEDTDAVNVAQLRRLAGAIQIHDYSVNSIEPAKDLNYDNKGATGDNAMAAGVNAIAEAENATAVGNMAIARNKNSTAVGNMALASKDSAVAIGDDAQANIENSVAIGSGARTVEVVGTPSYEIGGTTYKFAGAEPVGTVSVGTADEKRTITNVAAGRISEESTDAINGSQLWAVTEAMKSGHTEVTVGEGTPAGEGEGVYNTAGNLDLNVTQAEDGHNIYDLKLAKDIDVDTIVVNGKDGKDGKIGINGKDGETSYITVSGKDGAPGVDGVTTTRILIDDKPVATLDDGLKYTGDFGDGAAVKLNKTVNVVGNAASKDDLVDGNIGVTADQNGEDGKLTIKLNKDIDLGDEGSITFGDVHIHDGDEISFGDNVIHNVAPGVEDNDVVNVSQLKQYSAAARTEVSVGDVRVTEDGTPVTGGNLELKRTKDENDEHDIYDVRLAKDIDVDTIVVNGKDGKDGKIGINGEDGVTSYITVTHDGVPGVDGKDGITRIIIDDKPVATLDDGLKFGANAPEANSGNPVANKLNSTVNIKAADAVEGHTYSTKNLTTTVDQDEDGNTTILVKMDNDLETDTIVVNGKDGKDGKIGINGKDGVTSYITVTHDGVPGVDGKDGITRIIIDDKPVATLDDGLKYTGDFGDGAAVKLNKTVNVVGNAKNEDDLVDGNIGVTADQDREDGKLTIKLNKDINLGDEGSITFGDVHIHDGDEISFGDNVIHNVAPGVEDNDVVNVSQLKQYSAAARTEVSVGDVRVTEDGTPVTGGNLELKRTKDENDEHDIYDVRLAKDIDVDTIVVNGKDGKDGAVGLTGKDGVTRTITITKDGAPGLDGKDGEVRIVYEDGEHNTHEVATLDDGLKFGANKPEANSGNPVANKLNSTINILGEEPAEGTVYSTKNLTTTVDQDEDGNTTILVKMNRDLDVDTIVVNGKDGKDGKIGINGEDGQTTTISVQTDGKPGLDGEDGITRIVYKDPEGNDHDVATLDDGLKYAGDFGDGAAVKLNNTVNVKGEAENEEDLTDGNIGVVANQNANGKDADLIIKLNKDIDLTPDGSVTMGDTVINNDGLTINEGPSFTKNKIDVAGNKIINVAPGEDGTDAVNVDQLKEYSGKAKTEVTVGGGVKAGTDGNYNTGGNLDLNVSTAEDGHEVYDLKLADQVELGGPKDGKDGVNGSIGVNGADGKSGVGIDGENGITVYGKDGKDGAPAVAINGKDGVGHIGLTGPAGADGKDASADIHVQQGPVGVDGTDGADGTDGMDRIVYEDHNGTTHEVATLDDGMKYSGDFGNTKDDPVPVKLNNIVDIVGESTAASEDELSDGNIGVVAKADGDGAKLVVKLNKNIDLTEEGSVTMGDTVINNDGLTINEGPSFTKNKIDVAGNKIINVAPGEDGTDAVNVDQLKEYSGKAKTEVTVGGGVKAGTDGNYNTGGNLDLNVSTAEDGHEVYDLKLADQVELGGPKDGKDGVNGSIGVNGADGKSGVGIDGKDGITVYGKDGKDGDPAVSIRGEDGVGHIGLAGPAGKDGKDGISDIHMIWGDPTVGNDGDPGKDGITRIEYTDPEGNPHQVATMDDGLYFGANSGDPNPAANKLTSTVEIKGAGEKDDENYSGENLKTIISQTGEGAEAVTTINVVMDKDLNVDNIAVNGKDGKDGTIGINGRDGTNGKDGTNRVDIQVGPSGEPGLDGKDGVTRIIYEDGDGEHEVATLDDGMKYTGDFGDGAAVKLNKTVNVVGEAKNEADLTTGNIGVVAAQDGDNGKLTVKLNKDIDLGDKGSVKMGDTKINNEGLTINEGPSVTKNGIDAGSKKITNVAPGEADTDAVNVSQLKDFQGDVNQSIGDVNNRINRLGDRVDKVGAGAAALAGLHPLDFDPDAKWDVAAGYGHYRGENAVAVGAFYRPSEDVMVNVASTVGNGDNMISAGVSVKVGGNTHVSNSRVALSKQVLEMRKEIEDMRSLMADSAFGKQLDLSKLQLFPDTPENHWAYDYVATLAGNGLLEGYPDGNFRGDRALTRYEVAAILYRAMMNGAQLTQRALEEFAPELDRIRVDTLTRHSDGTPSIQRVRIIKDRR